MLRRAFLQAGSFFWGEAASGASAAGADFSRLAMFLHLDESWAGTVYAGLYRLKS